MLTYDTAMEFFRYEPSSGKLFWKKSSGKKVKVGAEVGCIKKDTGYRVFRLHGENQYVHRVVMLIITGGYDEKLQVDHIDHDRLNNRPENLRLVSQHENLKNVSKKARNTSGVVGVSYITRDRRWVAQIYIDKKSTNLGYFKTLEGGGRSKKGSRNKIRISPQPRFINSPRATNC